MKKLIALMMVIFSFSAMALDVGFDSGNNLNSVELSGSVRVFCTDSRGTDTRFAMCYSNILSPNEYARIVVTNGTVDADKVSVVAYHADGSSRSKSAGFDSVKGESTKRFNLWISTVFQRPLLDGGENRVVYTFTKNGAVVLEGEFTANVNEGQARECPYGTIYSSRGDDCKTGAFVCDEYFRKYNYCR